MNQARFYEWFTEALKKHASIKGAIQKKVEQIIEHPELGEPLKGDLRGFYSVPVKKSFLIIFRYCAACRRRGDNEVSPCNDCSSTPDNIIKFIGLGPHDQAYKIAGKK